MNLRELAEQFADKMFNLALGFTYQIGRNASLFTYLFDSHLMEVNKKYLDFSPALKICLERYQHHSIIKFSYSIKKEKAIPSDKYTLKYTYNWCWNISKEINTSGIAIYTSFSRWFRNRVKFKEEHFYFDIVFFKNFSAISKEKYNREDIMQTVEKLISDLDQWIIQFYLNSLFRVYPINKLDNLVKGALEVLLKELKNE